MSRMRSIKPEFWTSPQIVECSTSARLLFIGLWNFCDDGGVHPACLKRLKMQIFPADDFTTQQISGWVEELKAQGLLTSFSDSNEPYWKVTGWHHQKIDRPHFKYPQFDDRSAIEHRTDGDDSTVNHPRKGMEGKGKELKEITKEKDSLFSEMGEFLYGLMLSVPAFKLAKPDPVKVEALVSEFLPELNGSFERVAKNVTEWALDPSKRYAKNPHKAASPISFYRNCFTREVAKLPPKTTKKPTSEEASQWVR